MNTHASLARRPAAALLVALLALTASACGTSGRAWVAQVNGHTIANDHFAEGIVYFDKLQGSSAAGAATTTTLEGRIPVAKASGYAIFLVQSRLIESLNAKRHIKVDAADLTKVRTELNGSGGVSGLKSFPTWFQDQIVNTQAQYEALIADYGKGVDPDAAALKYYNANKSQYAGFCVDVITTASDTNATSIRQQIKKPGDINAVAKSVATKTEPAAGTKKDGDLGCTVSAANLAQSLQAADYKAFSAAPDGSVLGPYSMAGGLFLIIRKRSATTAPFADEKASIEQQLGTPGQAEATAALNKALTTATIKLNPRYGTWTKGVGYTAPAGSEKPKSATTTLPALAGGDGTSTPAG